MSGKAYGQESKHSRRDAFGEWVMEPASTFGMTHRSPPAVPRKIITGRGARVLTQVRDNFWDVNSNRILQILLPDGEMEDFMAWQFTKSYTFSVRSAYHLKWESTYGEILKQNSGESESLLNPVWKQLWKLNVQLKVKIFMWRTLRGVIPCRAVLADRHIGTLSLCPVCEKAKEDTRHALFTCE